MWLQRGALGEEEVYLAAAVVTCLKDKGGKGKGVNMIMLGGDARVRECQRQALPSGASLGEWIRRHMASEVEVRGVDGSAMLRLCGRHHQ